MVPIPSQPRVETAKGDYVITTDPGRVDTQAVASYLTNESYWALVDAVTAYADSAGIGQLILATADAHGPYESYGFQVVPDNKFLSRLHPRHLPNLVTTHDTFCRVTSRVLAFLGSKESTVATTTTSTWSRIPTRPNECSNAMAA